MAADTVVRVHPRKALWRALLNAGEGSSRDLAARANLQLGRSELELDAMCVAGWLVCERVDSRLVYRPKQRWASTR